MSTRLPVFPESRRANARTRGVEIGHCDVIQVSKKEARIMRYELSDNEWTIIGPILPNKARGVPRIDSAGNAALTDEYPTRPPHPKPKPALSPEQEGVIALIDCRKTLLRRANNLLAKRHDQGDGGIDLVLGQLLARKDIVLGVAVPDHIGEAPG